MEVFSSGSTTAKAGKNNCIPCLEVSIEKLQRIHLEELKGLCYKSGTGKASCHPTAHKQGSRAAEEEQKYHALGQDSFIHWSSTHYWPHSSFTELLSPSEGESGDFQSKVRAHICACLAFTELKKMRTGILKEKKEIKKWCWEPWDNFKREGDRTVTPGSWHTWQTMASWWKTCLLNKLAPSPLPLPTTLLPHLSTSLYPGILSLPFPLCNMLKMLSL